MDFESFGAPRCCPGGYAPTFALWLGGFREMLARDLAAYLLVVSPRAGVDIPYPKENKKLSEQRLATGGAIISEVRLEAFAAPQNLPRRNRILSGVSIAVLVDEAGENSGTRITPRCALEQNRDLFRVPGNLTHKNSWTPNTLIKQGAKLVATWGGRVRGTTLERAAGVRG